MATLCHPELVSRLCCALERVQAAGWPPVFIFMLDEAWELVRRSQGKYKTSSFLTHLVPPHSDEIFSLIVGGGVIVTNEVDSSTLCRDSQGCIRQRGHFAGAVYVCLGSA